MVTVVTWEVGSIGRDFVDLAASEAGTDNDMVAADERVKNVLYWDTATDFDVSTADVRQMTVNGDTSDATRFRSWEAAAGQEYNAKAGGSTGRVRFNGLLSAQYFMIYCIDDYIQFEGLGFVVVSANHPHTFQTTGMLFIPSEGFSVRSCYGRNTYGTATTNRVWRKHTGTVAGLFINCIADGSTVGKVDPNPATEGTYRGFDAGGVPVILIHCVANGCRNRGFEQPSSSSILRNCIGRDSGFKDFSAAAADMDYCHSEDNTADDAGGANSLINQADPFVDAAGNDFRLAAGSTAIRAGHDQKPTYTIAPFLWDGNDFGGFPHNVSGTDMGAYAVHYPTGPESELSQAGSDASMLSQPGSAEAELSQ